MLPFVPIAHEFEVLLVTSRHAGRWILPKGWPSAKLSMTEAAAREAQEEAGLIGTIGAEPIGAFDYRKLMPEGYCVRCHVHVYPFLVLQHRVSWPERHERKLRWCSLAAAARLVDDRGLGKLLAGLATGNGGDLRLVLDTMHDSDRDGVAATAS